MNPNRQTIYKPVYYLQRPESPKNMINHAQSSKNLSLTMSIGAKQSPTNFFPMPKPKGQSTQQQQTTSDPTQANSGDRYEKLQNEMKYIAKENNFLKEQNEYLKKELMRYKRQNTSENVRSSEKYPMSSGDANDLRGTIKKESGEIRELKLKLDMVSKQCKMYEEMIDKMDERMKKLVNDQHKKTLEIDELRQELGKIDQLKDKINSVIRLYNELESKFNSDQLQWMKWKQNWLSEKEYYMNIIHQLQKKLQGNYS